MRVRTVSKREVHAGSSAKERYGLETHHTGLVMCWVPETAWAYSMYQRRFFHVLCGETLHASRERFSRSAHGHFRLVTPHEPSNMSVETKSGMPMPPVRLIPAAASFMLLGLGSTGSQSALISHPESDGIKPSFFSITHTDSAIWLRSPCAGRGLHPGLGKTIRFEE